MKQGDRVSWRSHSGKGRLGTFLLYLAARPGYVVILGDDGKHHTMRKEKPQRLPGARG